MAQIENHLAAPVPKLHGRPLPWRAFAPTRRPRLARDAAVVVLVAGAAATLAWTGFLAWCLLSLVRLALG
jgi:ferric-dicitrate binding protein FerR (iron transport regulator)